MNKQACPLCGGSAEFRWIASPEGKRFECPVCTRFFIDEHSEHEIASMVEVTRSEFKRAASKHAQQSGPNRLYVLREPRQEEFGGDGRSAAKCTIFTEWIEARDQGSPRML